MIIALAIIGIALSIVAVILMLFAAIKRNTEYLLFSQIVSLFSLISLSFINRNIFILIAILISLIMILMHFYYANNNRKDDE